MSGLIAFFENGTTPEQRRVDEQTPRHDEAADEIDQAILWILSICEHKRLLQISCKPKEGDVIKARLTEEEEDRIWLEPLEDRALVERIIEAGADGDTASVSIPVENIK